MYIKIVRHKNLRLYKKKVDKYDPSYERKEKIVKINKQLRAVIGGASRIYVLLGSDHLINSTT